MSYAFFALFLLSAGGSGSSTAIAYTDVYRWLSSPHASSIQAVAISDLLLAVATMAFVAPFGGQPHVLKRWWHHDNQHERRHQVT